MRRTLIAVGLWLATATWLCLAPAVGAENERPVALPLDKWAVMVYGGIGTNGGIEDIPGLRPDFNDAYMLTAACSRELALWHDLLALEVEGQVAQHFKKQDHCEVNMLLAVRWMAFPWNDYIRTRFAVGEGVSYASSVPVIEREKSPDKTSKLLNYLMIELELAPPQQSRWSIFTRIHHRSNAYGLYGGATTGSNILGVGVKYRF
jgi:hypothetical protein